MGWQEDMRESTREEVVRAAVSAVHEAVSEGLEGADDEEQLMVYLRIVSEIVNSVTIIVRHGHYRKIIFKNPRES